MAAPRSILDRLFDHMVFHPGGCWESTYACDKDGYPRTGSGYVHLISYKLFKGAVPQGMQVDHTCNHKRCFNPAHLEAVTPVVNIRRKSSYDPTQCKHGHPRTPENTFLTSKGYPSCLPCQRASVRKSLKKRRDARKADVSRYNA